MTQNVNFLNNHKGKNFKTLTYVYKSAGFKLRILENGEIIERYTGKIKGVLTDKEQIEDLLELKGRKLDFLLEKLI